MSTNKWKAAIPRGEVEEGEVAIVMGIKTSRGYRAEFVGKLPENRALQAWLTVISKPPIVGMDNGISEAYDAAMREKGLANV
ncbi:hypothetical protein [Massilia sp. TS11]|uniref:hypothetical protein n=1 Tax=Massilia sp. TS11 TaxID=2908003 RepID=UPI001EDBC5AA|nr:hypothetical protein [Massilia sp. TS11]MCG2586547.1 hypothetical protein [Massilia sp. TS11]